jgi:hypothetical protein
MLKDNIQETYTTIETLHICELYESYMLDVYCKCRIHVRSSPSCVCVCDCSSHRHYHGTFTTNKRYNNIICRDMISVRNSVQYKTIRRLLMLTDNY